MRSLKEERLLEKKLMNDGNFATIIEYYEANDITIQFEDGKTLYNRSYGSFKNGYIRKFSDEEVRQSRIGSKKRMNCGMDATIIEYFDNKNITVLFDDGYISKNKEYRMFLCGKIHNKNIEYKNFIDLTDKRFGRWTVLYKDEERIENKRIVNKSKGCSNSSIYWICKCDCGNIRSVESSNLKSGASYSCGCYASELTIKMNKEIKPIYGKIKEERKDLIKYLVNKDDENLTIGSKERIKVKCPICQHEKFTHVYTLVNNGFSCPNCSETLSYPNRLMYKILLDLGIKSEPEKKFEWSRNKRYDFYIEELSCIIEVNGLQHYKECSWNKLEDIKKNDIYKKELAIKNGIKNYIEIDARSSDLDFIRRSVESNNEFSEIFKVENINWTSFDILTLKTKNWIRCCLLYKEGKSYEYIKTELGIKRDSTINNYLKRGICLNII